MRQRRARELGIRHDRTPAPGDAASHPNAMMRTWVLLLTRFCAHSTVGMFLVRRDDRESDVAFALCCTNCAKLAHNTTKYGLIPDADERSACDCKKRRRR